ncbi:MAG: hypothetical protein WCD31_06500 [Gillisia sp.]
MGTIEDKHKHRKNNDSNPLDEFGDRNERTNRYDIDDETIKEQENKE